MSPAATQYPKFLRRHNELLISTIEMHTCGEPTRIIYDGYPALSGPLLAQRAEAQAKHDHIRRALIHEPRGHKDMYGAVLRPETEMTGSGPDDAHIGVLFLTHEGYSTITISFRRDQLIVDKELKEVQVRLHVPCGQVKVAVPVVMDGDNGFSADTSRNTRYISVPSYVAGMNVEVPIPKSLRWPALGDRAEIAVDIAYGGAFFVLVSISSLGLESTLEKPDLAVLSDATAKLKAAFNELEAMKQYLHHPDHKDLQFLYSDILTEQGAGTIEDGTAGVETGLCFFGDQQIDRSPTGSGVLARVALAYVKGERRLGEQWTYHSPVSREFGADRACGFIGMPVKEVQVGERTGVIVEVSGMAHYIGAGTHMLDPLDVVGRGFSLDSL